MNGKIDFARVGFPILSVLFAAVCMLLLNNSYKSNDFYIKCEDAANKNEITGNETADNNKTTQININTADISELSEIPGIGVILAERIIEYRKNFGAFKEISEITSVRGIGDATFEKIKDYITV